MQSDSSTCLYLPKNKTWKIFFLTFRQNSHFFTEKCLILPKNNYSDTQKVKKTFLTVRHVCLVNRTSMIAGKDECHLFVVV